MNDYRNEDATPEEQRVARFMQAIERMHHDPAEAARIDLLIAEAEELAVDDDNQQIVVHVHNDGEGNFTNITSGDSTPIPLSVEFTNGSQHQEPGRLAGFWPSMVMVPIVIAAVLLSSRFESWSVVGAALPAMALLLMEVAGRPSRKKTRGGGPAKIRSSDRELNRR
ncbi:hypothetical protein [Streptomyces rubiginosohelvolus]